MGGRGSGGAGGGGARGGGGSGGTNVRQYQSNPSQAPIGTRLTMGGYTYIKTGSNAWRTTSPSGKRASDRTNADIKRVFT